MRKTISTGKAPKAIGPYSQAVQSGDLIYTAGQLGLHPQTGEMVAGGIEAQTQQALENLRAILDAAGSGLSQVIKTTVFLKNMNDFAAMNAVYASFFPAEPPARSAVEVARLPKDALVEVEAVARVGA